MTAMCAMITIIMPLRRRIDLKKVRQLYTPSIHKAAAECDRRDDLHEEVLPAGPMGETLRLEGRLANAHSEDLVTDDLKSRLTDVCWYERVEELY